MKDGSGRNFLRARKGETREQPDRRHFAEGHAHNYSPKKTYTIIGNGIYHTITLKYKTPSGR